MAEMIFSENCKVAKFKAPEGDNYRKIVKDYMMKMANIEWTPKETFSIKWKGEPRFDINLTYRESSFIFGGEGKTYQRTGRSNSIFRSIFTKIF